MSKKFDICVVGATGAVGEVILSILDERNFPINNLYPLASANSAGKKVFFQGKPRRKTAQASRCQHTVTGYDDDERIF